MSTQTPSLNLTLPIGTEKVSRQIINDNMVKIDQYCGAINQSTYRIVPFTITVADWALSSGVYKYTFTTAYVTDSSDEILTYSSDLTNAQAHIVAEKQSGGGGVVFTTSIKPTGVISGKIRVFDNDDGKIPVLMEDTVLPIANGGTGESTLNGAKQAFGINALNTAITNVNDNIGTLQGQASRTIQWISSGSLDDCTDPTKVYSWGNVSVSNIPAIYAKMYYIPGDVPMQYCVTNDGTSSMIRINTGSWSSWTYLAQKNEVAMLRKQTTYSDTARTETITVADYAIVMIVATSYRGSTYGAGVWIVTTYSGAGACNVTELANNNSGTTVSGTGHTITVTTPTSTNVMAYLLT